MSWYVITIKGAYMIKKNTMDHWRHTSYKMGKIIRSLLSYFLAGCGAIIFFIPCLCIAAATPASSRYTNKYLFWCLYMVSWSLIKAFFLKITVKGAHRLINPPAIIIANHASALDIPVLEVVMKGKPHLWYALTRFFSTPILGFLLRRIAIPVDQDNPVKAARSFVKGIALCRATTAYSVLFPEGGRYLDENVHEFFSGFAMMARKLGQPVVPVKICGLGAVYPPGSFAIHAEHPVEVIIGEAFVIGSHETDQEFSQRVRQWFMNVS
jgi:1-acyl-sn-glycerol-3-phosphate acyltransferase